MTERELERRTALVALMAIPDPPELRRGHRFTYTGNPFTREQRRAAAAQRSTMVLLASCDADPKLWPARPAIEVVRRRA